MGGLCPSQCTYRCVVLPDLTLLGLPATLRVSQCTYRCVVLPDGGGHRYHHLSFCLNAPTGAWCSLTEGRRDDMNVVIMSQCTYRCVVLPDTHVSDALIRVLRVSMHLQVRGAP